MAKQTPEGYVMEAVCDYLGHKGWFFFRVNNVGIFDVKKGTHRSLPKYAVKGVSDIIAIKEGVVWFIEVKSPVGKMSEAQIEFEGNIERKGGNYIMVRCFDDLVHYGF